MKLTLLHPVVFSNLKVNDKLVSLQGDNAVVTYVAQSFAVLRYENGFESAPYSAYLELEFRLQPLCWVEGKPVYPGDGPLYYKHTPSWSHNTEGVTAVTLRDDELHFHGGMAFPIADATWTKPKLKRVPSFQVEGVDVYPGDTVYYYGEKRGKWGKPYTVADYASVIHLDHPWGINSFTGGSAAFRLKPMLVIGDQMVPMPERKFPTERTTYYTPNPHGDSYYSQYSWWDAQTDQLWLERGLVHLNKEAAIAHGEALVALSKKED